MFIKKLVLGALSTNCYIISSDGSHECAVIDPADSADEIISCAGRLGKRIVKILLTHCHFDHIGALTELVSETGAEVVAGIREKQGLCDPSVNLSGSFGYPISFSKDVTYVKDGDSVSVGKLSLSVIETPGHTVGSVCYITDRAIFSGDTVFRGSIGRTDFPGGSYGEIIRSLCRVLSYPEEYAVYSGHGDDTTVGYERSTNRFYNL